MSNFPSVMTPVFLRHVSGQRRVIVAAAVLLLGLWLLVGWITRESLLRTEINLRRDAERVAEQVGDSITFGIDQSQAVADTIDIALTQLPDPYTVAQIAAPVAQSALEQIDATVIQLKGGEQPLAMTSGADRLPACAPIAQTVVHAGHGQFALHRAALRINFRLHNSWNGPASICAKIGAERLQFLFESAITDDPLLVRLVQLDVADTIASPGIDAVATQTPLVSRLLKNFPLRVEVFGTPGAVRDRLHELLRPLWLMSIVISLIILAGALRLMQYVSALELAATRDGLTGLFNRRYFYERAETELPRQQRERHSIGVVLADIDHFKRINDTYGHAVGDEVLRAIAGRLRAATRASDLVGRYGGEEFIILLSPTDAEAALVLAERLRTAIASEPVATEKGPISVTLSAGLTVTTVGDALTLDALAKIADGALYQAKEGGRNRVVVSAPA